MLPPLFRVMAADNPHLVLTPSHLGVSLAVEGGGALLWGLGRQGQGIKGAVTLGLKSRVCLGGHSGQSSCSLWTEPGLVVPGKTTARLEGRRQLDTFPAALENPKVPNALPNSRVGEGGRGRCGQSVRTWAGAGPPGGPAAPGGRPQLRARSSEVCYVPPDFGGLRD